MPPTPPPHAIPAYHDDTIDWSRMPSVTTGFAAYVDGGPRNDLPGAAHLRSAQESADSRWPAARSIVIAITIETAASTTERKVARRRHDGWSLY